MPGSLSTEEFLNACEHRLRRAEGVVRQPIQLQAELIELEELLRNGWPDAIMNIKETGMTKQYEEKIEIIFRRISKLESVAKSSIALFDGIEGFLQRKKDL
jgi:hypothetical protein